MKMSRNIGHHEQVLRVGLGVLFLALSGFSILPVWADLSVMVVGLVAVLTGIIGYCPAWQLLEINTCSMPNDEDSLPHSQSTVHERTDTSSPRL